MPADRAKQLILFTVLGIGEQLLANNVWPRQ
jgi:hypothetical protein